MNASVRNLVGKSILSTGLLLTSFGYGQDLNGKIGQSLELDKDSAGLPLFGATYSYTKNDPIYYMTFAPKPGSVSNLAVSYLWNFYIEATDSYLLPWDVSRQTFLTGASLAISDLSVVKKLVVHQKMNNQKEGGLYFVIGDDRGKALFNFSISALCKANPRSFENLNNPTESCDKIEL